MCDSLRRARSASNQGKEQRGFFIISADGFCQGSLRQILVVAQPGSQGHKRRGQPVARRGKHQLFGGIADGFLAYQLNIRCLQNARGLTAHDGILSKLGFQFLPDLDLPRLCQ